MSKRFTDSEKWLDPWFAELAPSFKLAWLYLVDRCDSAGVIDLSPRIAAALIGEATDWEDFIDASGGRVVRLDGGKLWLTGFIAFQHGDLRSNYNPHKAAVRIVEKLSLPVAVDGSQPTPKPAASLPQASVKLLGKSKNKDKDKSLSRKKASAEPDGFAAFYAAYPRRVAKANAAKAFVAAVSTIRGRDGPGGEDPEGYLISAAQAFAASDIGKGDQQYIPHPATWLNGGRFDDDPQSWRRDGGGRQAGRGQRRCTEADIVSDPIAQATADGF